MHCMKCGAELETEQFFCENCQLDMEKYPIAPGTAVHLPVRQQAPSIRKQPRRRKLTADEKLPILQKQVRILTTALVIVLLLLAACIYPATNYFIRHYNLRPGQNYTTVVPTTPEHPRPSSTN